MTPQELEEALEAEWNYRYEERLGILCGDKAATCEQRIIAKAEANDAVKRLRKMLDGING